MLVAGAALHCIGCIEYYKISGCGHVEVSDIGQLIACNMLGALTVDRIAIVNNCCGNEAFSQDTVDNLCHMILSQDRDDGGPGSPVTPEAKLLQKILNVVAVSL